MTCLNANVMRSRHLAVAYPQHFRGWAGGKLRSPGAALVHQ